jgi:hypothetical protein
MYSVCTTKDSRELSVQLVETKRHGPVLHLTVNIMWYICIATATGKWQLAIVVLYWGIYFKITHGISVL